MSHKQIAKPTWIEACDLCGEEITEDERSESVAVNRTYQYSHLPHDTARAKRLWFKWRPPIETRVKRKTMDIEYEFHAACFDKMVRKYAREAKRQP